MESHGALPYASPVRWASSISDVDDFDAAIEQASDELRTQLDSAAADLLLAFVSREHQARWHELPGLLRERFPAAELVGCSAGGVLADGRELERAPGLALAAAQLPGVELTPFHLDDDQLASLVAGDASTLRARWCQAIGLADGPDPHLLLLPDPFTWPGPELLAGLDRAFATGIKLGGLASGGSRPGEHRLFCGRSAHHRGLVGLALRGNIELETVVAQGCRPIGSPMFVTRRQGGLIYELDGRPAVEMLHELFAGLAAEDRNRARHSLFLGVVMDPLRESFGQGDFLIRNLVGVDPDSEAIAVAAELEGRHVVQFHLRDAETSSVELRELLAEQADRGPAPAGALLFSCLGRGVQLYGVPDHDSRAFRDALGAELPIAGFFCNGEIGPVAGRTFVHGYTSAAILIRPATMV